MDQDKPSRDIIEYSLFATDLVSLLMGRDTKKYRGIILRYMERNNKSFAVIKRLECYDYRRHSFKPYKKDKNDKVPSKPRNTHQSNEQPYHKSSEKPQTPVKNKKDHHLCVPTKTSTNFHEHHEKSKPTTDPKTQQEEEVVWNRKHRPPMHGRVLWTGPNQLVAVVTFDQETNFHPGCQPFEPEDRIININKELQILPKWISQQCQIADHPREIEKGSQTAPMEHKTNGSRKGKLETETLDKNVQTSPVPKPKNIGRKDNLNESKNSLSAPPTPFVIESKPIEAPPRKFQWDSKVSPKEFCLTVSNSSEKQFGIQGINNSCYMDASIYSLFAFNNTLDILLSKKPAKGEDTDNTATLPENMKGILRLKIVKHLRHNYFVSSSRMNKLRKLFVQEKGQKYGGAFMDAEEFMLDLFTLINVDGLFTYDHGAKDYIHQILLPYTWHDGQKTDCLTLQSLVEESFKTSEVKLKEIPKSAFIIKLPISEGKLIPCNAVITNMTLDLANILDGEKHNVEMNLHAVICLRSHHFVTFVRMDQNDKTSKWVFMDSNPTTSKPEVYILDGISEDINQAEKDWNKGKKMTGLGCGGYKLFRDAYMCIYVPE